MSRITTHVLDTTRGRPAAGVPVTLEMLSVEGAIVLSSGSTDREGRLTDLLAEDLELEAGRYRIRFDSGTYFREQGTKTFYPEVVVIFEVRDPGEHYHIPLLLSPHGYTTYRGT
jgi:5-hydroxyisourate hydrolase